MADLFDNTIAKAGVAAIAIGLSIVGAVDPAHAAPRAREAWPVFAAAVENAKPPNGWAEFCKNYRSDCDVKPSTPRQILLNPKTWKKIVGVNKWANQHIIPMTDRRHWGRI